MVATSKKYLISTVIIVIVIICAVLLVNLSKNKQPIIPTTNNETNNTAESNISENKITIKNFGFTPTPLTIKIGTAIIWTNEDSAPHTVTANANEKTFDSGRLAKGQTFSHTFDKQGVFNYICAIHPNMKGQIIVIK